MKRFKSKKKVKFKPNLIIVIIALVALLYYLENNIKLNLSNKDLISGLFESGNSYITEGENKTYISDNIYSYIRKNIFNSPINILKNQVDYERNTEVINFNYVEKEAPKVYIYNSHQGETYSMEYLENYNIVPDVIMAANMLKDKLENLGVGTVVENSDILSYMKENNMNHADSYRASRIYLKKAIETYPNLDLYIDLHRDAATHKVSTTTINNKECAKILFVIGLEYDTYQNNLSIVEKINDIVNNKYPGLSRGIMKKEGYGVNGVYNQDLASNVILIEIGGNENNIEEVNNTLDLVADAIKEYINEKE